MAESAAHQLMMNNLSMNSQIMQSAFDAVNNLSNRKNSSKTNQVSQLSVTNNVSKVAYAVEGDSKYDKEIDTNGDGIITYNEYVRHIAERASKYNLPKSETTYSFGEDSKTGLFKFSVNNINKVFTAYMANTIQLPTSFIEKEA